MTLASFKLTVTLIVLFSAAANLSSPAKLTVITASPSARAIILPSSTLTTEELLTEYVTLPASAGVKEAPATTSSPTTKSTAALATLISVGIVSIVTVATALVYPSAEKVTV